MDIRLNHQIPQGKASFTIKNPADGSDIKVCFPVRTPANEAIPDTRELMRRARESMRAALDEADRRASISG
jgi:hypothetical protein